MSQQIEHHFITPVAELPLHRHANKLTLSLVCCRDIMARMLPHLPQEVGKTQILPFYSFAAVQRDSSAQDAADLAKLAGTHHGTLPTGGLGAEHARHSI